MKQKTETIPTEWIELLARMEKEQRFWQTLSEIGFKHEYPIENMESIKHYSLPISTSFFMDKREFMILAFTQGLGSWIYPSAACYIGEDGGNYVHFPLTIPVMTCENFIKWHIHKVRKLTDEILLKLVYRTI